MCVLGGLDLEKGDLAGNYRVSGLIPRLGYSLRGISVHALSLSSHGFTMCVLHVSDEDKSHVKLW